MCEVLVIAIFSVSILKIKLLNKVEIIGKVLP